MSYAVIGASGKMGRGIALLLLQQAAFASSVPSIKLVDLKEESFPELKSYLKEHLKRFAEKNIVRIRNMVQGLPEIVSNEQAIRYFLEEALKKVDCSTAIEHALSSRYIFEAAFEDVQVKTELLTKISQNRSAWVMSNTSSIPIGHLAEKSGLNERLIGYHFYNPPPVQKLLEIIPSSQTDPALALYAKTLADALGKKVVYSKDVAGFIGNGHFAREALFACSLAEEMEKGGKTLGEAVRKIDFITKELLLRPMGIFELLRYVGLDVAGQLIEVMRSYLPDPSFQAPLLQKLSSSEIVPVESSAWKRASKEGCDFKAHFASLSEEENEDAKLAVRFLKRSFEIEKLLVDEKVASSLEDVGTVLKLGFHHLYAPHEVL